MKENMMSRCGPTAEELLEVHAQVQAIMAGAKAKWPGDFRMADGDDDDTNDLDDDASGDDGSEDDSGTEGQEGKGKKDADDDASGDDDAVTKARARMKAADQRAAKAERELRELKDKDKPELERAQSRVNELEPQVEALTATVHDLRLRVAFLTSNEFTWENPATALKLADLSEVEVDEDGNVTGLQDALKKLAKSDSYLLKKADKADDEDDEDDVAPSGSLQNGKRKGSKKELDRAALAKKYPALRR